jgi:hypothetical protein
LFQKVVVDNKDGSKGPVVDWVDISADTCPEHALSPSDDNLKPRALLQKTPEVDTFAGSAGGGENIQGGGGGGQTATGRRQGGGAAFEYAVKSAKEIEIDDVTDSGVSFDQIEDVQETSEWQLSLSPEYQLGFTLAASTLLMFVFLVAVFKALAVAALLSQAIAVLSALGLAALAALVLMFGWKYVLMMALRIFGWIAYYLIRFGWPVLLPGSILWLLVHLLARRQKSRENKRRSGELSIYLSIYLSIPL